MLAISGSGQYVFSRVLLGKLTTRANTAQVARACVLGVPHPKLGSNSVLGVPHPKLGSNTASCLNPCTTRHLCLGFAVPDLDC
jgi:hypothetical protein